jgi:hypothetical protein
MPSLPHMQRMLLVLVLASCSTPKTAAEQAKYAAGDDARVGEVDGDLAPREHGAVASSAQTLFKLTLRGVADGALCVRIDDRAPLDRRSDGGKLRTKIEEATQAITMVAGAYDSLNTFKDWPDQRSGVKGRMIEAETKNLPYRDADGESHDSYYFDYILEWCAPVPAVTATTKFITVSTFDPKADRPALFVWRIKGAAVARGGTASPPTSDAAAKPVAAPVAVASATHCAPMVTSTSS